MSPRRIDDSTLSEAPRRYRQQPGQPRRKVGTRVRSRTIVALSVAGAVAVLGAGGGWLWKSGLFMQALDAGRGQFVGTAARMGLVVDEILVTGRKETSRESLLASLGLMRGAPILAFDPEELKARVEALPWVKSAAVQRLLPDTVVVRIAERSALALWQQDGKFSLIDTQGNIIPIKDVQRFGELLVVVGADAPTHAAELIRIVATQPDLAPLVKAAVRVGARRWNIQLDGGIEVQLPEEDPASAWAELASYDRTHKLLSRDVQTLDLRLPGRLIVKTKTGQTLPQPQARKGQST
jgi:cell division protein FtsQ